MTRWGKFGLSLCATVALLGVANSAMADFLQFNVIPAYAPKGPEAPSWNNYVVNALGGIQLDQDLGDRTVTPAAYERVTTMIPPEELVYTNFNSWRAVAAPNALPPGYEGELGNRIHFGLHVVGDSGFQFALDDLEWKLDSDDSSDYFDQDGDFSGASYSATRIGIDWVDGVKGGNDVIVNTGAGTQLVNELIYVGVGDGFFAEEPGPLTDQEQIDITISDILAGCTDPGGCLVDVTMTYTLPDSAGTPTSSSGTFTLFLVPEPSSAVLALMGLAMAVAGLRRRR